jgi:hypothetical protein
VKAMDRSTLMCLVFFLGLGAHAILASASSAPAFAWSNTDIFSHREATTNQALHHQDLTAFFGDKNAGLSKYVNFAIKPEIVVLFVEDKLTTARAQVLLNGGSLPHVQNLLSSSSSSLLAPVVTGDLSYSSLLQLLPSSSSVVFVGLEAVGSAQTMTLEQLISNLQSSSFALTHNGVTDLVVVSLHAKSTEEFTADDNVISRVESAFGSVSHVSVLISAEKQNIEHPVHRSPALAGFERRYVQATDDNSSLFPDGIVAGLIIMIPFLVILAIGISCSCALQSELKFDAEKTKKQ